MNYQYLVTNTMPNLTVDQKKMPSDYLTQPSFGHHTIPNQSAENSAKMQRVLILGSSGSGKSTMARHLGAILGLPVIHLDRYFWHSGWVETPWNEWKPIVDGLVHEKKWILDGNYRRTLNARLQEADTAIFLDLPPWLCMYRAIKRRIQYANRLRPDIAPGCQEKLLDPDLPQFLCHIWQYSKRARPEVHTKLYNLPPEKQVVWLQSSAQIKAFLLNPFHPKFIQRPTQK